MRSLRACLTSRLSRSFILLLLLTMVAGIQTARAFTVNSGSPTPKWTNPSAYYYFDSSFTHQGITWQNLFNSAINEWNTNAWLGAQFFPCSYAGSPSQCQPIKGVDYGQNSTYGQTNVQIDWLNSNRITGWVTNINTCSCVAWYTGTGTPPSNQVSLWSVMKHEIGHSLGLCHSGSTTALMYKYTPSGRTLYVGSDATNGDYYLYYGPNYSGPGPEGSCIP